MVPDQYAGEVNSETPERECFICPKCGTEDREFYNEVLRMKIGKKQLAKLSDEQMQFINKKYEYGVLLCDDCYEKVKRRAVILKLLYFVALILLAVNVALSLCMIPVILLFIKTQIPSFDFDHVWNCSAVRRIRS